jgi:excisionase family DNA binding protein
MAAYLSVQGAALRLGVSPHTIRRWTASGFLPCTRTAGGHRRIKQEDIDELAHLIGGRNHLAARLTCERQLESLAAAALLLAGPARGGGEPAALARQVARLLDGSRCVVSAVKPSGGGLDTVAVWDAAGATARHNAPVGHADRPLVARVLQERRPVAVNVGDPRGDPAEVAMLRRDGDKCLLLVPVVLGGRPAGLLEVFDHLRERRLSAQELRLAEAGAALVAVGLAAVVGADEAGREEDGLRVLRRAVACVAEGQPELARQPDVHGVLRAAASLAVEALAGIACVASCRDASAGATDAEAGAGHAASGAVTRVLTASAPCGGEAVTLTLTLGRDAGEGETDVLALIAAFAAAAAAPALHA